MKSYHKEVMNLLDDRFKRKGRERMEKEAREVARCPRGREGESFMIDIKAVQKGIQMLIDDQYKALSADKPDEACAASHRGQIAAYQHVLYILSALEEREEKEEQLKGFENLFEEEET